jgi:hypothetical protein
MRYPSLLYLLSLVVSSSSSASAQAPIRFTASDTINVFAVESSYWPFDTTWVAPIAYDLGSDTPYPFSVEVYRDELAS